MEEIKKEYVAILERMEELLKIFNEMKGETEKLKTLYQKNPNDEKLLNNIKLHEENFKLLYEEFNNLNKKAKKLAEKNK